MQAFRARRHALFASLLTSLPRPLRILDVGGNELYWRTNGVLPGCEVVLLNKLPCPASLPGFSAVIGDACNIQFPDAAFDFVFSNSVIEHVGCAARQQAMADEVRRVGQSYFVQAPYRHFPLEPHWLLPLFQYWPRWARVAWTKLRFRRDRRLARYLSEVDNIRLPTVRDFRHWFPEASIHRERVGPLTKSLVAYHVGV